MQTILTPHAPKPGGHYSQAVEHNGLIYVSGQLPIDPRTGERLQGSMEEQCELVLKNVRAILEAANSSLAHVLKVTLYITDISQWETVNRVYARHFAGHQPARAIVPVAPMHHGVLIEMECIAAVKGATDEYFYFPVPSEGKK